MQTSNAIRSTTNRCPKCCGTLGADLYGDKVCLNCGKVVYAPSDIYVTKGGKRAN